MRLARLESALKICGRPCNIAKLADGDEKGKKEKKKREKSFPIIMYVYNRRSVFDFRTPNTATNACKTQCRPVVYNLYTEKIKILDVRANGRLLPVCETTRPGIAPDNDSIA